MWTHFFSPPFKIKNMLYSCDTRRGGVLKAIKCESGFISCFELPLLRLDGRQLARARIIVYSTRNACVRRVNSERSRLSASDSLGRSLTANIYERFVRIARANNVTAILGNFCAIHRMDIPSWRLLKNVLHKVASTRWQFSSRLILL